MILIIRNQRNCKYKNSLVYVLLSILIFINTIISVLDSKLVDRNLYEKIKQIRKNLLNKTDVVTKCGTIITVTDICSSFKYLLF